MKVLIHLDYQPKVMKIMSIFGTRPEIIRLSRIFSKLETNFEHIMVNTNQNFTAELNQIFFSDLKIRKPDYNLKVNTEGYGKEIAEIIEKSELFFLNCRNKFLDNFYYKKSLKKFTSFIKIK